MICHTVRNGGCIFLILCLWVSIANSFFSKSSYTVQEFCSGNSFMHNIEPGSPIQLKLKSETFSARVDKWFQKSKRQCRRHFKTSDPASHFVVLITNMTIPSCSNCKCNFFEISVAGLTKRYCGNSETEYFSSKSDAISIYFQPGISMQFDVTFTFSLERNHYIVTGMPSEHKSNAGSFIETPYFPIPYSPNYRAEYTLQSEVNSHVVLLFLDFQISEQSFIEVAGNNGTHPTRYHGNIFRPPVIVSEAHFLDIKFESSNNIFGMPGFRAECSFIKTIDSLSVPYTDCGGYENGRVGYMNIKTHETFSLYDCVWHISSSGLFYGFGESIWYRSVSIQMKAVSHKSFFEIRNGKNSKAKIVKVINCEADNCKNLEVETTVHASSHLYIRFNGYLDKFSVVNMSYSTYYTGNCSSSEFECENGRCLPYDFRCDGIKQCPNGTDEQQCPSVPLVTPPSEAEVTIHPNVKEKEFDDTAHKKFLIILIVGIVGFFTVIGVLLIFMYKYHKSLPTRIEQAQSQTVGEMADVIPILYPSNVYTNDSPPSYEDFIKSADSYPPLLYTRAKQRFVPKDMCAECTTSFSNGTRPRHHSTNSFNFQGSDNTNIFVHNSRHASQEASNCCSVEIFNRISATSSNVASTVSRNESSENIRKWYSLDSKLNDLAKQDTCHLFLSIIHPVCGHASNHPMHIQCHTLPANFKISSAKNADALKFSSATTSFSGTKERSCTWSFKPHGSNSSEILTVVKTRCCSDPCKGISVHYSLR